MVQIFFTRRNLHRAKNFILTIFLLALAAGGMYYDPLPVFPAEGADSFGAFHQEGLQTAAETLPLQITDRTEELEASIVRAGLSCKGTGRAVQRALVRSLYLSAALSPLLWIYVCRSAKSGDIPTRCSGRILSYIQNQDGAK